MLTRRLMCSAVYAERLKLAEQTGETAAKIANKKIKKIKKINENDIYNALVVLLALGGRQMQLFISQPLPGELE